MANPFDQFDQRPQRQPASDKKPAQSVPEKPKRPAAEQKAPAQQVRPKVGTGEDVTRSYAGGLIKGLAGLSDAVSTVAAPFAPGAARLMPAVPGVPRIDTMSLVDAGIGIAERITGRELDNPAKYVPQTQAGRYAQTGGEFTPNAVGGVGGAIRRGAQVVIPAVVAETSRWAAEGAGLDERGQQIAKVGGAMIGGGVAARPPKLPGTAAQQRPLVQLNKAAPQVVEDMRTRAEEFRGAGVRPTLVDVVDEGGRGYLSGAAMRMPARPAARAYADQKRVELPGKISGHAARIISDDMRTPREIAEKLAEARETAAKASYGAVRDEPFQMAPETVQALRSDYGKAAIAEAARRERDPEARAALLRLSQDALDDPSTPITIGMADRISRVLYGQARAAGRDNDLASTLTGIADAVRKPARTAVPGYGAAVDEFAAGSRLMEAADRGEDFLKRDTDNFVADLAEYAPGERPLARATARRAIERAVGESPASAPSVAERLAIAPEQMARNRALLGDEDAGRLQDAMRLEVEAYRNAQRISPTLGSPTAPKSAAADAVAGAIDTGVNTAQAFGGNVVPLARQLLRAKGLNDQQAARLVQMATDPDQLDDVLIILEARIGRQGAQEFLRVAQQGGMLAAPALISASALE